MSDDFMSGFLAGQSDGGDRDGGFFGSDGLWAIIIFAMIFGYGNGFGGFGGLGGGVGLNGALTRAELYDGFAVQNIDSAVRGVQQGICDSTYALNNTITGGFAGVNSALCNLGYQTQSGLSGLSREIGDCCCTTQRSIDGVKFDMAKGLCDLGNVINMQTRDIIDNANANYRGIMDFLVGEKLASKDAKIVELTNQLSQSNQNAVLRAAIDASTAEIIRRTGHDCPSPAYWVSPPTPVQVPCGNNYGFGRADGCGCGC